MDLVKDSLSEATYDARLAGLRYSISNDSTGILVSFGGYNDKLSLLLNTVVTDLRDIQFKPDRLQVMSEQVCCAMNRETISNHPLISRK